MKITTPVTRIQSQTQADERFREVWVELPPPRQNLKLDGIQAALRSDKSPGRAGYGRLSYQDFASVATQAAFGASHGLGLADTGTYST